MKLKNVLTILAGILMFAGTALAASYTVEYHGFIGAIFINASWKDTDECSVYIQNPAGLQLEAFAFIEECQNIDTPSSECVIHPEGTFVVYSIHLDDDIRPNTGYNLCATCDNKTNCHDFNVTAPTFDVYDFNQNPQVFSTMKFSGRIESHHKPSCVVRISDTDTGITVSLMHNVTCPSSGATGLFSFDYPLVFETAYKNHTLNITCDNYATHETTFKPIFLNVNDFALFGFTVGMQALMYVIAAMIGMFFLGVVYVFVYLMGWLK